MQPATHFRRTEFLALLIGIVSGLRVYKGLVEYEGVFAHTYSQQVEYPLIYFRGTFSS